MKMDVRAWFLGFARDVIRGTHGHGI